MRTDLSAQLISNYTRMQARVLPMHRYLPRDVQSRTHNWAGQTPSPSLLGGISFSLHASRIEMQ